MVKGKTQIIELITEKWDPEVPFTTFLADVVQHTSDQTTTDLRYISDEALVRDLNDYRVPVTA